jgi:hypothetical protein
VYANPNGASPPSAAVTGGVVVRDPALTPVYGRYLYADFYAGQVHSAALAKPVTDDRVETALPTIPQLVDFGEDAAGHVYVVSLAGSVQRIVCDASCPAPSGGGTSSGPPAPPDTGGSQGGGEPQPTAAPADTTPPRLTIHAARVQDVLRRRELRLSVACDEACIVRVSAPGARTVLKHLGMGKRVVYRLRTPARVRRALARRGRVTITVRGRDATGNLRTAKLTVRVKRR